MKLCAVYITNAAPYCCPCTNRISLSSVRRLRHFFWKRSCRYVRLLSYLVGKFYRSQVVAVCIRVRKQHLCGSEMWHLQHKYWTEFSDLTDKGGNEIAAWKWKGKGINFRWRYARNEQQVNWKRLCHKKIFLWLTNWKDCERKHCGMTLRISIDQYSICVGNNISTGAAQGRDEDCQPA